MKHRLAAPSALIDLARIAALKDVSVANGTLTIGAMTRHVDVARSGLIATSIPALSTLAEAIGDPAVRNRGKIDWSSRARQSHFLTQMGQIGSWSHTLCGKRSNRLLVFGPSGVVPHQL
jgi:hypothetical protein